MRPSSSAQPVTTNMRHPSLAEELESALAQNFALLRWLARRVCEASGTARRGQFLREFGRVIEARFSAMEQVVAPELQARGCPCEVSQGVFVHRVLRPEVAELLQEDIAGADFERRAAMRFQRLLDHLQRESAVLSPCIAKLLSFEDRLRLGRDVRGYLGLPDGTPDDCDSSPMPLAKPACQD
jgi:hypothetical protein